MAADRSPVPARPLAANDTDVVPPPRRRGGWFGARGPLDEALDALHPGLERQDELLEFYSDRLAAAGADRVLIDMEPRAARHSKIDVTTTLRSGERVVSGGSTLGRALRAALRDTRAVCAHSDSRRGRR